MQFIEKGKIMLKEILEFLYSKYKILSLAIMLVVLVFGICLFIQNSGSAITGGNGFQKNLVAGTYYVTAKFTVNKNIVSVSGSFTIKDEQDTSATIHVKKNDLNGMTVADALANTQYAELTYDGLIQDISGRIIKVNSTPAGNTVYVTSIEVFVKMTGTTSTNYVLMTVPVNASFTNVAK